MLTISDAQIAAWIAAWTLPFFRIAALFAAAPIFQEASIPRRVKLGLALLVTAIVAPGLAVPAAVDILSPDGVLLVGRQIAIGAAMGLSMRLAFTAVEYAGDLIGLQMGLGFALLVNPETNDQSPIVGSFLGYLAMLAFLAANGHLVMLGAVVQSFTALPLVAEHPFALDWGALVAQGGTVFALGLHLALPIITVLLLTNIALGVLTRAAPQLNLFSVGFPLTILVGLGALLVGLPVLMPMIEQAALVAINQGMP